MMGGILMVLMFIVAVFLILLVLVQRGRGGGLAGALGGMGGQSAFGTKAGDLFTRITIGAAAVWILLCVLAVKYYNAEDNMPANLGSNVPTQRGGLPPNAMTPDEKSPATDGGDKGAAPGEPATSDSSAPAATDTKDSAESGGKEETP